MILMPQAEENNFEVSDPLPAFVLDSVVLCCSDTVVEIEKSYYRGDKYKFAIVANPEYYGNSVNTERKI